MSGLWYSSLVESFIYLQFDQHPRLLHTYTVTCSEMVSKSEKEGLRTWVEQEKEKAKGDDKVLADRLGLDVSEVRILSENLVARCI